VVATLGAQLKLLPIGACYFQIKRILKTMGEKNYRKEKWGKSLSGLVQTSL
jgi:hypothetical protein